MVSGMICCQTYPIVFLSICHPIGRHDNNLTLEFLTNCLHVWKKKKKRSVVSAERNGTPTRDDRDSDYCGFILINVNSDAAGWVCNRTRGDKKRPLL